MCRIIQNRTDIINGRSGYAQLPWRSVIQRSDGRCVCREGGWHSARAVHNPVCIWHTNERPKWSFLPLIHVHLWFFPCLFGSWIGYLTVEWLFVCTGLWMNGIWSLRKQTYFSQWWNECSVYIRVPRILFHVSVCSSCCSGFTVC